MKGVPRGKGARLDDDANLGDVTALDVHVGPPSGVAMLWADAA